MASNDEPESPEAGRLEELDADLEKAAESAGAAETIEAQSFRDLATAARPIVQDFLKSEQAKHEATLKYDHQQFQERARIARWALLGGIGLVGGVLFLSWVVMTAGRPELGTQLVRMILTAVFTGVGGYGVGRMHQAAKASRKNSS